jgi:hypothetical protein
MTADPQPVAAALRDPDIPRWRATVDELLDRYAAHANPIQLRQATNTVARVIQASAEFGPRVACLYLRDRLQHTEPAYGASSCLCEDGWIYTHGARSSSGVWHADAVTASACPRCNVAAEPAEDVS